MADAPTNGNGIRLNTPFGPIAAKGTAVFIVLAIMSMAWVMWEAKKDLVGSLNKVEMIALKEHHERQEEHANIRAWLEYDACMNRLSLYIVQRPRGEVIDWTQMPQDLYECAFRSLTDVKRSQREGQLQK